MILCSDGHTEIAYEDKVKNCPLCLVLEQLEDNNKSIAALKDKVDSLETDVESLDSSLDDLMVRTSHLRNDS